MYYLGGLKNKMTMVKDEMVKFRCTNVDYYPILENGFQKWGRLVHISLV